MPEEFKVHWTCHISNTGGYEIELSNDGESARVRKNYGQEKLSNGRRQEVKYDGKWRAYVKHYTDKLLLEVFEAVDHPR